MAKPLNMTQVRQRKTEILAQIKGLQKQLQDIEQFESLHSKIFSQPAAPSAGYPPNAVRHGNPPSTEIVAKVREILRVSDRPLNRNELLHELRKVGINLVAQDPATYLNNVLLRYRHVILLYPYVGYCLPNSRAERVAKAAANNAESNGQQQGQQNRNTLALASPEKQLALPPPNKISRPDPLSTLDLDL